MPTGQPGKNVQIIYKVEAAYGTKVAAAAPNEVFRPHPGPSFSMDRAWIADPEVRRDGMESMGRLGFKKLANPYAGTLSVGTFDTWLAALFRHAWAATALKFTCDGGAAHTSLATTANTVTLVGTDSFITTHGVRVGDVIRLGAMGATVDNINAVVSVVAANVITVLGSPWAIVGADANATFTVMKKLKNALGTPADPMVRSSYTIEERYDDLDESKIITGARVGSLKLTFTPGGVAKVEFGLKAQNLTIEPAATSPYFITPTEYTSIGMIAVDASIYLAGAAIATITGGELTFDISLSDIECVGAVLTPDLYEGAMAVSGQITAVTTAFTASHLARFLASTDNVEASIMFIEPDAAVPVDFVHFFIPRLKYAGDTMSFGEDGPIVETIPVKAACKETTTGYDSVVATISTSV